MRKRREKKNDNEKKDSENHSDGRENGDGEEKVEDDEEGGRKWEACMESNNKRHLIGLYADEVREKGEEEGERN